MVDQVNQSMFVPLSRIRQTGVPSHPERDDQASVALYEEMSVAGVVGEPMLWHSPPLKVAYASQVRSRIAEAERKGEGDFIVVPSPVPAGA